MTDKEFQKLFKEWKHRLFLDDWIISASLVPKCDIEDAAGECTAQFVNKCASIHICKELPKGLVDYPPIEKTLIHELLHCKFMSITDGSLESVYYDTMQHQLLDDMAKALYSIKYDTKGCKNEIV